MADDIVERLGNVMDSCPHRRPGVGSQIMPECEGDGSSTFWTLPMCFGHRLALGEHVIFFEPIAEGEARRG